MGNEVTLNAVLDPTNSLADKFDAVKKLDDVNDLEEVILKSTSTEIRSFALSRIENDTVLEKVVREDDDATIRRLAITKIGESASEIFEWVARNDDNPFVREQAVLRIPRNRYDVFADILLRDDDSRVRHRASQKLRFNKLSGAKLRELAIDAIDPHIRRAATYSITEEDVLQEIAILGDDIQIIQHCISQLKSQENYMSIYSKTEFVTTKVEILNVITDRDFVENVIDSEQNEIVHRAAEHRLMMLQIK